MFCLLDIERIHGCSLLRLDSLELYYIKGNETYLAIWTWATNGFGFVTVR